MHAYLPRVKLPTAPTVMKEANVGSWGEYYALRDREEEIRTGLRTIGANKPVKIENDVYAMGEGGITYILDPTTNKWNLLYPGRCPSEQYRLSHMMYITDRDGNVVGMAKGAGKSTRKQRYKVHRSKTKRKMKRRTAKSK
jgi:hypothetical protein